MVNMGTDRQLADQNIIRLEMSGDGLRDLSGNSGIFWVRRHGNIVIQPLAVSSPSVDAIQKIKVKNARTHPRRGRFILFPTHARGLFRGGKSPLRMLQFRKRRYFTRRSLSTHKRPDLNGDTRLDL